MTMDSEVVADILTGKLSMMAGVGDAEPTKEEKAAAIYVGHQQMKDIYEKGVAEVVPPIIHPEIPSTVGTFQEFQYKMDEKQKPYCIDDKLIQSKLDEVYKQDKAGELDGRHGMVVASSASLGTAGDVLADAPTTPGERILLYMCGGGFISSDIPMLRWHYLRVSAEANLRVFVPQYSVAPDHVFPRALHDTYTAYLHLLGRGFSASDITIFAVSAGANIGMAMMRLLEIQKMPQPAGAVLISPCLDLTLSFNSWKRNQDVCVLHYHPLESPHSMSRVYLGPVEENAAITELLGHPLMSPLFGNCASLPPIQIQIGLDDVLIDEATELARKIEEAHAPESGHVELITYPGMNHYTVLRGKTQLTKVYENMRRFINSLTE